MLLANASLVVTLDTRGMSDAQVDRLADEYGPQIEGMLEEELDALASMIRSRLPSHVPLTMEVK